MPRKRILLADDDATFVEAVTTILSTQYEVTTAKNGTEALEEVARERPDLIVLDVMMDHLSEGFDVARKLKGDPATREIPVVMLTGVDEVYDYRMEVGESYVPHDRYLEKPVRPADLLAVIEEAIGDTRS